MLYLQIFGNPFIFSLSSRYIDFRSISTTHLVLIIKQQVETAELISYIDIHCCRGINTSSLSTTTIYSQARSWSNQNTCFKCASTYKLRERNTLVMMPEQLQITCSSEKHNFSLIYKSTGVKHTQKSGIKRDYLINLYLTRKITLQI